MKKKYSDWGELCHSLKKTLLIMRIALVLLLAGFLQTHANDAYAQKTKVSVSFSNTELAIVLDQIENESEFFFLYNEKLIDANRKVSIDAKDERIDDVLKMLFTGTNVEYTILDRKIILAPVNMSEFQQTGKKVTGKVTDSSGASLPGVSVVVKGTSTGVITDNSGNYSFANLPENATLQFSFVGMKTIEVAVGKNSSINVTLEEETIGLDEVVAIGYGTAKKRDLTGSVSSISSKSFLSQPASSTNSLLAGRVPGVSVRRDNGAPGRTSTIRIRGANSLRGNNDPLIVVDGNYGSLPEMYDIESIEVLKDASATAIYGSRGANGVILVTTKRGNQEKPSVQLYSDFSFENMPKHYDLMDAYEFAEFNKSVGAYPFTNEQLAQFKTNGGTNWQDEIMRTGLSQNYKAILTGGSKAVKYYISPSYKKSTGTILNTEAGGYGLSAKVDMDLSKRIIVQIESYLGHSNDLNTGMVDGGNKDTNPLLAALVWSPTEPIFNQDGTYYRVGIGSGTVINPLLLTTIKNTKYGNSGSGIGNLKIKIIEGLEFNAKGSVSISTGGGRSFSSQQYNGTDAMASQSSSESINWLVNAFLNYSNTFAGNHNFSAMAGIEETKGSNESLSGSATKLPIESLEWYNLGAAAPNISVSSGYGNSALRSFFGRVNYNYSSRYYLTMNYRADGSSKFKDNNLFGFFPSFALAWRLSEEKFMKNQDIFQNVKIRGGWGVTGSQAISSYATYSTLSGRSYSWGLVPLAGYNNRLGGNPDLKWESTNQIDMGLDLKTLNNRLSVTLDYYNKKTVDLLAPVLNPSYSGGGSVTTNVGSVQNIGFEVNLDYDVLKSKDWTYYINLNGAINRNKVLNIGDQDKLTGDTYASGLAAASPFVLIPGEPIGSIYGYKYLGIWQESEAAEAAKFQQTPGDYKYDDLNSNYTYDLGDNQVIGNTNPKFTWGFNNLVSYKNFDLNILVEGIQGRDVLNWTYMVTAERIDFSQSYTLRAAKNRWSRDNPNAEFAKIGATNRLSPLSSIYMQDGDYVKLRNISLACRIPKSLISFAAIKLSVSAQNLLTFTKYKGYDPEVSSSSNSDTSSGMDWFAYPNPRALSFGVSIEY